MIRVSESKIINTTIKFKDCVIAVVERVIGRECAVHKSIWSTYSKNPLKNKNKNKGNEFKSESNFADIEGAFDVGNMNVTHLDIGDLFNVTLLIN